MDYTCVKTLQEIRNYLGGAEIVAFDFETSPGDSHRNEEKAALDAHKAHIDPHPPQHRPSTHQPPPICR